MRYLDKDAFEDLLVVLWIIWNARNNAIFREIEKEASVVWERAKVLKGNFCLHNFMKNPLRPRIYDTQKWRKPPNGVVKINVDAVIKENNISTDMIACDNEGFVPGGFVSYNDDVICVEWA